MITAELSYNPYLLETKIKFNGQPPRVNSLVEKYENMNLQSWITRIPKIFYDEMNGYYFELDFKGTQLDYDALCNTFRKAGITKEIVPIIHKEVLEDRITKQNKTKELLAWLRTNPNRRFDFDEFRAENSELFEGSYTYVFLHGQGLNDAGLEDMNISVEYVDSSEELNNTDLRCTPILIYVTEKSLPKLAGELAYFKAKPGVTEEQLFFLISDELDRQNTDRVIRDLGVANPNIVDGPADERVRLYFEVYPIATFIGHALEVFRAEATAIGADVERDNEENIIVNREIHERIQGIEDRISSLRNVKKIITEYSDDVKLENAEKSEEEILKRIGSWRGNKTKIYKSEEAIAAAIDFEKDVKQWLLGFGRNTENEAENRLNSIRKDLESEYRNLQYDDFQAGVLLPSFPDMEIIKPFFETLLKLKEERYVEAKEDLIGMLFRTRQTEEKQMSLETTYHYKDWRDCVAILAKSASDRYIKQLEAICEEYLADLKNEYINHIDAAAEQEILKKEEVSSQLSEDEKKLQIDNEWLAQFKEQIKAIERG